VEGYEIRLRGWRRLAIRVVRQPMVANVGGWFDCSVPGIRGRLEPWRWKQQGN
jgi:hypothetical protein